MKHLSVKIKYVFSFNFYTILLVKKQFKYNSFELFSHHFKFNYALTFENFNSNQNHSFKFFKLLRKLYIIFLEI